jgi:putative transposase
VFIKIKGKQHYLWRAVDQDGDTLDILVQQPRGFPQSAQRLEALSQQNGD